jgi:hypothetical protein
VVFCADEFRRALGAANPACPTSLQSFALINAIFNEYSSVINKLQLDFRNSQEIFRRRGKNLASKAPAVSFWKIS